MKGLVHWYTFLKERDQMKIMSFKQEIIGEIEQ